MDVRSHRHHTGQGAFLCPSDSIQVECADLAVFCWTFQGYVGTLWSTLLICRQPKHSPFHLDMCSEYSESLPLQHLATRAAELLNCLFQSFCSFCLLECTCINKHQRQKYYGSKWRQVPAFRKGPGNRTKIQVYIPYRGFIVGKCNMQLKAIAS